MALTNYDNKGNQIQMRPGVNVTVPSARLRNSSNQASANSAYTSLTFDTEDYDTDNMHDLVTNTSRITIKTAGKYYIYGEVQTDFYASANYTLRLRILKNGATIIGHSAHLITTNNNGWETVAATVNLAVGDYIELQSYQDSGIAINVQIVAEYSPVFEAVMIGPGIATSQYASLPLLTATQFGNLTNPYDGQEVLLQADATNGINWRMRYNASSASTYKWEFLGGLPLYAEVTTTETSSSGSYVSLATTGPSIVVPRAGDYDVAHGAKLYQAAGSNAGHMSYNIGATTAVDADSVETSTGVSVAQWDYQSMSRTRRKTGLAASTTLLAQYKSSASPANWRDRWMSVLPVRIS